MTKHIIPPTKGLSDGFIRHLKPQAKRYEVADNACSGLCIRVGTSGVKSFVWTYRDPDTGKHKRMTLGRYGSGINQLSLSAARKALTAAKIKLAAGELNRSQDDTPKTVTELCEVFYKNIEGRKLKAPEAIRQVIDHDIIPVIGTYNLATLSTVAVGRVVTNVVDRGSRSHAGKVTAIVKQMFKFAESRGFVDRSPAYALDKKNLGVVNNVRENWLKAEELKPVWDALSLPRQNIVVSVGLKVLLLTGVRTGELLLARWENIDLVTGEWFIPAENTKTGAAWIVPLVPEVIELLSTLPRLHPDYVLSRKTGTLNEKTFGWTVRALFDKGHLTIDQFTPHDLRRTVRTHLEKLDIAPHVCEKCLNHSLGAINATYNKHDYLNERRAALETWTAYVYSICEGGG